MSTVSQPGFWSDPIGHLREGAEKKAGTVGVDAQGNPNDPGFFNNLVGSLTGATDEGTAEWTKATEAQGLKLKYKDRIEALKGTFTPGLTEGDYVSQIDTLTEQRDTGRWERGPEGKAFAARTEQLQEQNKLAQAKLTAEIENLKSTNVRLGKKDDQAFQLGVMQLQQSNQNSVNQLEYQKIRDRQQDQQYNERMEQLDRKDRRTAVQNMVAGLASLGAAFAL